MKVSVKAPIYLLLLTLSISTLNAQELDDSELEVTEELSLDEDSFGLNDAQSEPDFWQTWFGKAARISLKHEFSYKVKEPTGLVNNRTSLRLEYSKYFLEDFFVRFDGKLTGFWGADHQTGAYDHKVLVKEAFIQGSFGDTSVKLGRQMLIWGESEGGAITDVVAPRNLTELFYINLEESRLGQNMLLVDHFDELGDFSFFFVPEAKFNDYPRPNTDYYIDPFVGNSEFSDVALAKDHEYGFRYKKTLGRSDIALMYARLVDNDYITSFDEIGEDGVLYFNQTAGRLNMYGGTFNYATGNFLISGELAGKKDKLFNGSDSRVLERDVFDTAIALEYSINGNDLVGVELVNSHIDKWDSDTEFVPRNSYSLIFNYLGFFANEDFMVNWLSIFSKPYTNSLHSVYTTYKFDDNFSMDVNVHFLFAPDERGVLYQYRDQRQVAVKFMYQF